MFLSDIFIEKDTSPPTLTRWDAVETIENIKVV